MLTQDVHHQLYQCFLVELTEWQSATEIWSRRIRLYAASTAVAASPGSGLNARARIFATRLVSSRLDMPAWQIFGSGGWQGEGD